jgi:hypothetical protein
MAAAVLWVPASTATASLMDGGRRIKNIKRKRLLSDETPGGRWLFELFHENTGFEALHFYRKAEYFKRGPPLALSKLPMQSVFQKVERLGRVVADIKGVQNVPKDLLGQAGEDVGIFVI